MKKIFTGILLFLISLSSYATDPLPDLDLYCQAWKYDNGKHKVLVDGNVVLKAGKVLQYLLDDHHVTIRRGYIFKNNVYANDNNSLCIEIFNNKTRNGSTSCGGIDEEHPIHASYFEDKVPWAAACIKSPSVLPSVPNQDNQFVL